jgi:hypothetical protein
MKNKVDKNSSDKSIIESLGEMGFVNLELAGIFFVNAYHQLKEGEKEFVKLEKEILKFKLQYKKNSTLKSDTFEVKQLRNLRNLEIFYEPVVRYFSAVKILLICCAETYVNQVAQVALKGRKVDEFDKLSIIGKWIFIQDLLKLKKTLTIDAEPMQSFAKLVSERNKLVHYKNKRKSLLTFEIPNFLEDLSLTTKECLINFKAVQTLLRKFSSNWTKSSGPSWLDVDDEVEGYRNPCFYLGNREFTLVLHSDKLDKGRYE